MNIARLALATYTLALYLVAFVATVRIMAVAGVHPDGYTARVGRAALARITVTAGLATSSGTR